jgi:hypothetical protein
LVQTPEIDVARRNGERVTIIDVGYKVSKRITVVPAGLQVVENVRSGVHVI